jgi:UDP-glucose 4-epimerase
VVAANGGGEFGVRTFPADRKRIDIGDYYADYSRITSALGWRPRVPLEEGLARTIAFYREHLERYV